MIMDLSSQIEIHPHADKAFLRDTVRRQAVHRGLRGRLYAPLHSGKPAKAIWHLAGMPTTQAHLFECIPAPADSEDSRAAQDMFGGASSWHVSTVGSPKGTAAVDTDL